MGLQVIGAGWGRTGTLSLKLALEQLGFNKCYHMAEVVRNPDHVALWAEIKRTSAKVAAADRVSALAPLFAEVFTGYQANVDWPGCNYWQVHRELYPEAKVILSKRDAERWYKSVMQTIWPSSKKSYDAAIAADKPLPEQTAMVFAEIWDGVFDGRVEDTDYAIELYTQHNQRVIDSVPPLDLLVFDPADGWLPLCEFLQVPVPETDYPSVNSSAEFTRRWEAMRS